MHLFALLCGGLLAATPLCAHMPSPYATRVVQFSQGTGGGIFNQANILGAPQGGGWSTGGNHVLSLGVGGSVILGFAVEICDGPGADLMVFENGFGQGGSWNVFAELAFLEVSTDGVFFARVPNRYTGPTTAPGLYGTLPLGVTSGLVGATPVLTPGGGSPGDPCRAGGDAFDLADLAAHPLVRSGKVDLQRITYIRIIDIVSGRDRDSLGALIHDPGGGADIDAVAVINHRANQGVGVPNVALRVSPGVITLTIGDPDGIGDLDPATLHASLNGLPVPAASLLSLFRVTGYDGRVLHLGVTGVPVGLGFTMGFSVRDRSGRLVGSRRTVH